MAQTFTSTEVTTTTNVFGDNQSQRTNENTLRSNFSGATQPSDPVVGQVWYDTTNSKQMQYNGTSWVSIDTNGATQKDVTNAKGNLTSLTDYLRVAHNDDGTLKTSPATAIDEFKDNALAITYVSTSSLTVPTDLTSIFTANRKVKVYLDGSTVISYVSSSSYSSGDNKTTVVLGGNVLNSSVTAVKYSVIQYGERHDTVHTSDLSAYVTVDSPAFTGTPTAPTAASGTSTTQLATTEFVSNAIGSSTSAAPITLGSFKNFVMKTTSNMEVLISAGNNPYTGGSSLNLTLSTAVTGTNALDTGVVAANTFYDVYVCYGPSGTCGLLTVEGNTPTLPSGYTYSVRCGCVYTNGSKYLYRTIQRGRKTQYITDGTILSEFMRIASGLSDTFTATTIAVPSTAISARIKSYCSGSGSSFTHVSANNISSGPVVVISGTTAGQYTSGEVIFETTKTLYYRSNTSNSIAYLTGWEDNL